MHLHTPIILSHEGTPSDGNEVDATTTRDSIVLPPNVFQGIDNRENVGIFFALYDTANLFPVREMESAVAGRSSMVASSVLAATVGPGLFFNNLNPKVEINLTIPTSFVNFVSQMFMLQSVNLQTHQLIGY